MKSKLIDDIQSSLARGKRARAAHLIRTARTRRGDTALIDALRDKEATSVMALLDAAQSLGPDAAKHQLMAQTASHPYPALLTAIGDSRCTRALLDAAHALGKDFAEEHLLATDSVGKTALMIAADPDRHCCESLTALLEAGRALGEDTSRKQLLAKGGRYGDTALMWAAMEVDLRGVKAMLEAAKALGKDTLRELLLARNQRSMTSLTAVVSNKHISCSLIKDRAVGCVDALLAAVNDLGDDASVRELLFAEDAIVQAVRNLPECVSSLLEAASAVDPDAVRELMLTPAVTEPIVKWLTEDEDQRHLAWEAAGRGDAERLKAMLNDSRACGTAIELLEYQDDDGAETALMRAAHNGHVGCVKVILASAAEIGRSAVSHQLTVYDDIHMTALTYACSRGHEECVAAILEAGKRISRDAFRKMLLWNGELGSALWVASSRGHLGCVRLLLEAGRTVDATSSGKHLTVAEDTLGNTALIEAVTRGKEDCVKALLAEGVFLGPRRAGAQLLAASHEGTTALMAAAVGAHTGCMTALLEAGQALGKAKASEQILAVARDGTMALLHAVYHGHVDCVNALLAAGMALGTDVAKRQLLATVDDVTSYDVAQQNDDHACMQALFEARSVLVDSPRNEDGQAPEGRACHCRAYHGVVLENIDGSLGVYQGPGL
jgi:ankyrin repeat protein